MSNRIELSVLAKILEPLGPIPNQSGIDSLSSANTELLLKIQNFINRERRFQDCACEQSLNLFGIASANKANIGRSVSEGKIMSFVEIPSNQSLQQLHSANKRIRLDSIIGGIDDVEKTGEFNQEKEKMHGVKRVMVFCLMTAILPTILIITPLYLRHYVFADVTLQVAESDVLMITEGYSSIFCDTLVLRMNSSFNAFQLAGVPRVSKTKRHIRLKKSMSLPDDTLEYWGFYLLKEALVKLKVCSRHEGSRIMVVRGDKNLDTCGLMEHNYQQYGAKMDEDYRGVKVFDEEPADFLGELEFDVANNDASENYTDDGEAKKRLLSGLIRQRTKNESTQKLPAGSKRGSSKEDMNKTKIRHRKRHTKEKIESLKKILNERQEPLRARRGISPLDGHIKHGGNAMNYSGDINVESNSVSSFETDLLKCYDTKILLTRGFMPSQHCNSSDYLRNSAHMVTHHTVASDGYYYYIFYSDNDFVKNEIHAVFDIYKPTYRFANSSIMECINKTECEFPVEMLSDETVIVEVPTRDGIEHEEDDITLLKSTCKPRMGIYIIFPILVLFFILACAFL